METGQSLPSAQQDVPEPENRGQRSWLVVAVCSLLIGIVLSLSGAAWFWIYATSPGPETDKLHIQVYIPPQTGFKQIKNKLVSAGILRDDIRFALLAKFMGVAHRLKAGEYLFKARQTPHDILRELEKGKTILHSFTIAEGLNIFQIAKVLSSKGWGSVDDILNLLQDGQFIHNQLHLQVESLEGYLFPDTYFYEKNESLQSVVERMTDRLRIVLAEECRQDEPGSLVTINCSLNGNTLASVEENSGNKRNIFINVHQLLTLASIVEKETGLDAERPEVAQVFLHRLQKGMKLQADPTVVYGLKKFGVPLSRKDLRTPNLYNTYMNKGLPPGPICNPGQDSIRAVVRPGQDAYLYFVAQGDGSHYFSKTLKEHNRAVGRYRRYKSKKKE